MRDLADRLNARIRRLLRRSLHVRQLDAGSCNGCDWEIQALLGPVYDMQRLGIDVVASPRHADLLLVTGSVTRNLEEAARLTYEAMPEPRLVVAVGACACGGGRVAGELLHGRRRAQRPAGRRLHPRLPAAPAGAAVRSAGGGRSPATAAVADGVRGADCGAAVFVASARLAWAVKLPGCSQAI